MARRAGTVADLAQASDRVNRRQVSRVVAIVRRHLLPGSRVAVLGLAYRPDTAMVEESQALQIAGDLSLGGASVTVFDPMAMPAARAVLGGRVRYAGSMAECLQDADVAVIATPWPEFRQAGQAGPGLRVIVDCWGLAADPANPVPGVEYVRLGRYHPNPTG